MIDRKVICNDRVLCISAAVKHVNKSQNNYFNTGNLDRHHYGKITEFGENSHVILFDNGRG
jgi:hypothetical protein